MDGSGLLLRSCLLAVLFFFGMLEGQTRPEITTETEGYAETTSPLPDGYTVVVEISDDILQNSPAPVTPFLHPLLGHWLLITDKDIVNFQIYRSVIPEFPRKVKKPPRPAKKKNWPTFDPAFHKFVTKKPRRQDGYVLIAQDYYVLINMREKYDCSNLIFQEKVLDYYQTKDCLPTPNPHWLWLFPWIPDAIHVLHVRNRSTKKLLVLQTFYSLPAQLPFIKYTEVPGSSFYEVDFVEPLEKEPNLIGYSIYYAFLAEYWLDSSNLEIIYTDDFPYIRPLTPCPQYRTKKIQCVVMKDQMSVFYDDVTYSFPVQIYAMRVVPGPYRPRLLGESRAWRSKCYWHKENCPWMGVNRNHTKRSYTDVPIYPYTVTQVEQNDSLLQVSGIDELNPVLANGTNQTFAISEVHLRGLWQEDLFIIFLSLTIGLLLIFAPFMIFMGRRAGKNAARDRWSRLSSTAGTVNVPLGHGGAHWPGNN